MASLDEEAEQQPEEDNDGKILKYSKDLDIVASLKEAELHIKKKFEVRISDLK